jgi:hypothetical protein
MGQSVDALPLEERLRTYRLSADQALRQATQTHDPSVRASLLAVAAEWQTLATNIEEVVDQLNATHAPNQENDATSLHRR